MGYQTSYKLECDKPGVVEEVHQDADEDSYIRFAICEDGSTYDACKWYEHEEDMRKISLEHPGVLFFLSGEGEEAGDIWKKYFMDGKMQVAHAQIKFAKFDPKKLT